MNRADLLTLVDNFIGELREANRQRYHAIVDQLPGAIRNMTDQQLRDLWNKYAAPFYLPDRH